MIKRIFSASVFLVQSAMAFSQLGSLDPFYADGASIRLLNTFENESSIFSHLAVDEFGHQWVAGTVMTDEGRGAVVFRLTPNGNPDIWFNLGLTWVTLPIGDLLDVQGVATHSSNGYITGHFNLESENLVIPYIIALTENGSLIEEFGSTGVTALGFQGITSDIIEWNDALYVSGISNNERFVVCKVDLNGDLDTDFGDNGVVEANLFGETAALDINEDGNIYVFGNFNSFSGNNVQGRIAAFTANGEPLTGFGTSGNVNYEWPGGVDFHVADGMVSPDGTKLYMAGHTWSGANQNSALLAVDISSGQMISEFGTGGFLEFSPAGDGKDRIQCMTQDEDNIYLGMYREVEAVSNSLIIAINHDGTPNLEFGTTSPGMQEVDVLITGMDQPTSMAIDNNGGLLVSGSAGDVDPEFGYIFRLVTDVTLNTEETGQNQESISIYPNPANDHLMVNGMKSQNVEYRIHDLQGRVLLSSPFPQIDVSILPAGTYFLEAHEGGSRLGISKFIVNR